MHTSMKYWFICGSVGLIFAFVSNCAFAQTTGRAALAAKQRINAQVNQAMADGNISEKERRAILSKAKNCLTPQEYAGLLHSINRLSPPDRLTPENLGQTQYVDKKLMANFPAPHLPWIEKLSKPNGIFNQGLAKSAPPKNNYIVRETITRQTIVKESIPRQSIAKGTKSGQAIAKKYTSQQLVAKKATPTRSMATVASARQSVAKTMKPASSSNVVLLSSPPLQKNKKSQTSPIKKVQYYDPGSDQPASPRTRPEIRKTSSEQPARQKMTTSAVKLAPADSQAVIQQPARLWDAAERPATGLVHADYSTPALNTPAAAFLPDPDNAVIQASFDQPQGPDETNPDVISQ